MNIVEKKVAELIPYENNPRINENAVGAVAESIREFGFKVPIVIDKNNVIVSGHTRWKASQQLGLKTVPCILADDLTEEQIRAFRLADNKTAELATWDEEKLLAELEAVKDIDMTAFGFEELEKALTEYNIEEDEFEPEVPEEPKTKRGDIYELGDHRLMCGDSTSEDDLKTLMGGGTSGARVHRPTIRRGNRGQKQTPQQFHRSGGRRGEHHRRHPAVERFI